MQILEERHGPSARHPNDLVMRKAEPQDECKSISSALEEVQLKGTLVERVAMLENRLLQVASTTLLTIIISTISRQYQLIRPLVHL